MVVKEFVLQPFNNRILLCLIANNSD